MAKVSHTLYVVSESVLHTPYTVRKCPLDTLSVLLEVALEKGSSNEQWGRSYNLPETVENAKRTAVEKMDPGHTPQDETMVQDFVQRLYDQHGPNVYRRAVVGGSLKKAYPQLFSTIDDREVEWYGLVVV